MRRATSVLAAMTTTAACPGSDLLSGLPDVRLDIEAPNKLRDIAGIEHSVLASQVEKMRPHRCGVCYLRYADKEQADECCRPKDMLMPPLSGDASAWVFSMMEKGFTPQEIRPEAARRGIDPALTRRLLYYWRSRLRVEMGLDDAGLDAWVWAKRKENSSAKLDKHGGRSYP